MIKYLYLFLILFIIGCDPEADEVSESGDFDQSFNYPYGYNLFGVSYNSSDIGRRVVVQSDDRILVLNNSIENPYSSLLILRYITDGILDPSFGTNGGALFAGTRDNEIQGYGMTLQNDGKILVCGYLDHGVGKDILLLRFTSEGALDPSFGNGGIVNYEDGYFGDDVAYGVTEQKDGKILVVGESFTGSNQDLILLRYDSFGKLDTTFNHTGIAYYYYDFYSKDVGMDVAVQQDGKIVCAGGTTMSNKSDVLLVRYNSDGSLDSGFGTGGAVIYTAQNDNNDIANRLVIQQDGKIVAAGAASIYNNYDIMVIRCNSNGSLDNTFSDDGVFLWTGNGDYFDYAWGLALQSDNKILVCGSTNDGYEEDAIIIRLTTNGNFDGSFSQDGFMIYLGNDDDRLYDITTQSTGKIVATGYSTLKGYETMLIMRALN